MSFAIDSYKVESYVRGHHVNQHTWTLTDEGATVCKRKLQWRGSIHSGSHTTTQHRWACTLVNIGSCSLFLQKGGSKIYHSSKALFCQSSPSTLQIVHSWENHWIVITTLRRPVGSPKVCDSQYTSTDPSVLKRISMQMSSLRLKKAQSRLVSMIATCLQLQQLHGGNPRTITFDQQAVRRHFLKCFKSF